jgi:hypothetical protein
MTLRTKTDSGLKGLRNDVPAYFQITQDWNDGEGARFIEEGIQLVQVLGTIRFRLNIFDTRSVHHGEERQAALRLQLWP